MEIAFDKAVDTFNKQKALSEEHKQQDPDQEDDKLLSAMDQLETVIVRLVTELEGLEKDMIEKHRIQEKLKEDSISNALKSKEHLRLK